MSPSSPSAPDLRESVCFLTGFLLWSLMGFLLLFASLGLLTGHALSPLVFIPASAAALWLCSIQAQRFLPGRALRAALLLAGILIALCLAIALFYFDISWDGQTYHQETVIQLARGWNPVFAPHFMDPASDRYALYWSRIQHFPKAVEIAQACVYQLTGRIQAGKAVGLLMILATGLLVFAGLRRLRVGSFGQTVVYALILTLNPVALTQSLSFYIDGLLATSFLAFLAALVFFYTSPNRFTGLLTVLIGAILINVKFTGLIFFGFLAVGFCLFLATRRVLLPRAVAVLSLALTAGALIGLSPYLHNIQTHRSPFYPLIGPERIQKNLIQPERPGGFDAMNPLQRLGTSIFASSTISREIHWKIPMTFTKKELLEFAYPDLRLGAFGPLFGPMVLVSIFLLAAGLLEFRKNRPVYAVVLGIFITVLAMPESWWVRYAPQFWLVPILSIVLLSSNSSERWIQKAGRVGVALALLNLLLVVGPFVYKQTGASLHIRSQLRDLAAWKSPLRVDFFIFRSGRVRLEEYGVAYHETADLPKERSISLYGSLARIETQGR